MGTDITFHIEARRGGRWVHVGNPAIIRDYAAFAALGLTSYSEPEDEPPIAASRDMPADATDSTIESFNDYRFTKAPSWLTFAELAPHRRRLGSAFRDALEAMAAQGQPEEVRGVFWFRY